MIIAINPGHAPGGSPDPGAVSPDGTRESDITAAVGLLVSDYLQQLGHIAPVIQSDDLVEICNTANSMNADLFVSIHCNAAYNPNANGAETYYANGSVDGEKLARMIQMEIINGIPVLNRGVKQAKFYVLVSTYMPAVLVELAFLSNRYDESILIDHRCQRDFAKAIADGIVKYIAEVER